MIKGKKVNAFIQISLTSKRLPGKALLNINGKNSIERLIKNLKHSIYIDNIVLTFTNEVVDDPLEKWAVDNQVLYFRGDYLNVIKRYVDALESYPCDFVVRATGDCPVVSFELADQLIEAHQNSGSDYSKFIYDKIAIGIATEVFSASALRKLANQDIDFSYSEYMTYYFTNNPNIFSIQEVNPLIKYTSPNYRLTLDYKEDFEMFNELFCRLDVAPREGTLLEVLEVMNKNPDICDINIHHTLKYKTDKKLVDELNTVTKIISIR